MDHQSTLPRRRNSLSQYFPRQEPAQVSEDDDEHDCDMSDNEFESFTQTFYEDDDEQGADDDDSKGVPPGFDYSQVAEFDYDTDEIGGEESSPKQKRARYIFHDTQVLAPTYQDSRDQFYVDVEGTRKIFKRGESFSKIEYNINVGVPKTIYTIQEMYTKNGKKRALCKVSKLARETFIGKGLNEKSQDFARFVQKFGKYVSLRKSQNNVVLADLKYRVDTPETSVYYDPPIKDSKGAGWTIAYGFVGGNDKNQEKCCSSGGPKAIVRLAIF